MIFDTEINEIIKEEFKRQNENLEMIASENFTFPEVMMATGSILTNKYAEGYPSKRYYGGCEIVDKAEVLAIERCKKLFNCNYANVQPHSGSQANQGAYAALLNPGDIILGMDLSAGGHLTHGSKVNASGKVYTSYSYGVDENGYLNYDEIEKIALEVKPKLIVCGASAYARIIDFKRFRKIADKVGAFLLADIAHIAGLVVANLHPSPFPHAHIVTSTTHKTLRGPRGGIIMTNDEELAKKINSAIFPNLQGGPLMHIIAAKAVGFKYNLDESWKTYANQVIKNCKVLADELLKEGFKLVSGGTDNHLLLMDFSDCEFSGKDAQIALEKAGITANKNSVPNEKRSPFITSGLRLGTAALSARGMKEEEMKVIAQTISLVLKNLNNDEIIKKAKETTLKLSENFPLYKDLKC
ncbi:MULTISPECIES: serine hydroxymethyltransferase [unclassified Campylobacter]|uniref:serine hydroxymethyltransferase n=1 Tax=unclassified Campylobacter TaxID=2593542 RepID=UPI001BDB68BB|nr:MULTISPECIES: serine hydroxymethyltransferase [unclassified Campylobacter]MBT0880234.1 serine hydroxymethyltransferase [Campylobacter sp. 2018MI27]MBT0884049.1 serine hydroxymethyltransferase [Campylobacter sp. 2018MI10]